MKIIFLDIDGVLNSLSFFKRTNAGLDQLDPDTLARLKELVELSGARLVLTSSWRIGWSPNESENGEEGRILNRALGQLNLNLMCKTGTADVPFLETRCVEILDWLKKAPEPVESFVILDDGDYAWKKYGLDRFLVQTDYCENGLEAHHVTKALEILQNPPKPVRRLLRGLTFRLSIYRFFRHSSDL